MTITDHTGSHQLSEEIVELALTPQWLVVSKPAGYLTIPAQKTKMGVLSPVLIDTLRLKYGPLWVVHRLDRETSGVILFARSAGDHREANTWFQSRKVKKVYSCLALGNPLQPVFKLNGPIQGLPSVTQIEVKERYSQGFLAWAMPRTGRTHQIRIHLSGAGYPICGDTLYRGPTQIKCGVQSDVETLTFPRVALHATRLELPTGEKFTAPYPEDFSGWVEKWRKWTNEDGTS